MWIVNTEVEGKIEIELGYHILPDCWRKGFATEAAIKFRVYAFEEVICNSLISIIDVRNIASQEMQKKSG